MRKLELIKVDHSLKKGSDPKSITPNVTENTVFTINSEPVGFYLKEIDERTRKILRVANAEFLSDKVPKQVMNRVTPKGRGADGKFEYQMIKQKCTILGALAPKPHMRRDFGSYAQIHGVKSAKTFIKAMLIARS